MRTSCRSSSRSGPLTLGARAMISPWVGKVEVVVLSLGIVGLREPRTKQPYWIPSSYLDRPRSHRHQGLMFIHTMPGYRKRLEGLQRGQRGEGPHLGRHQSAGSAGHLTSDTTLVFLLTCLFWCDKLKFALCWEDNTGKAEPKTQRSGFYAQHVERCVTLFLSIESTFGSSESH